MQHKEWQDLIPFYVAQSLSSDDVRRFENHLAMCDSCQQDIDDWRSIASAVWRDTDAVARELPPLSPEVYNRLNYRDRVPQSRYSTNPPQRKASSTARELKQPRRFAVPITLVAGLVVAVLFGGLLMMIVLRPANDDTEIALNTTLISPSTDDNVASMMNPLDEPTSTITPDSLGIIPTLVPELEATSTTGAPVFFTNTPQSPPLNSAPTEVENTANQAESIQLPPTLPPNSGGGIADTSVMSATIAEPTATPNLPSPLGGGPYITVTPNTFAEGLPLCEAFNPTGAPIEIYTRADRNSEIVGIIMPDDLALVTARSITGWYLLRLDDRDNTEGWLQAGFAYLRGNCGDVVPVATLIPTATRIAPSPTPISTNVPISDRVVVIDAAFADLYQAPTFEAEIVGVAARNQQFPVIGFQGTGTNRWILVQSTETTQAWLWASTVSEYDVESVPLTATP